MLSFEEVVVLEETLDLSTDRLLLLLLMMMMMMMMMLAGDMQNILRYQILGVYCLLGCGNHRQNV
jgi:hypothetical protein